MGRYTTKWLAWVGAAVSVLVGASGCLRQAEYVVSRSVIEDVRRRPAAASRRLAVPALRVEDRRPVWITTRSIAPIHEDADGSVRVLSSEVDYRRRTGVVLLGVFGAFVVAGLGVVAADLSRPPQTDMIPILAFAVGIPLIGAGFLEFGLPGSIVLGSSYRRRPQEVSPDDGSWRFYRGGDPVAGAAPQCVASSSSSSSYEGSESCSLKPDVRMRLRVWEPAAGEAPCAIRVDRWVAAGEKIDVRSRRGVVVFEYRPSDAEPWSAPVQTSCRYGATERIP